MRQRFIQSFSTSGDVQTAIDGGQLGKPYVAYLHDEGMIDWNTKEAVIDYTTMPLTIEILEGGESEFHLKYNSDEGGSAVSVEYEINGDGEWEPIESITEDGPIGLMAFNTGDIIRFRVTGITESLNMNSLVLNLPFKVYGNIMSLLYEPNDFASATTFPIGSSFNFYSLFLGCTSLTDASNLVLPATVLTEGCYNNMFNGCTSLTTAPELPATTLANNCYSTMFYGCTSLTTAPELPAATLAQGCYIGMFEGCSSLNRVKCLTTREIKSEPYVGFPFTGDWLMDVATTGTFTKRAGVSWVRSSSGIPSGWTVEDAQL